MPGRPFRRSPRAAGLRQPGLLLTVLCPALLCLSRPAAADLFRYQDENGQTVEVEAELAGAGQGAFALRLADGQIRLISEAAVLQRTPAKAPQPESGDEMIARLTEQFGSETFRADEAKPYVVGVVLTSPLDRAQERRVRSFLKKGLRFMRNVETVFEDFARSMRLELEDPQFPLVVLIFETDDLFEAYTREATGGRGLSATNIAGFYSALTNRLAIRMSECHTFEVPLHEAIHQQVNNRGLVRRLAPVPKWFHEGIATGFEGNGEKISIGPNRINSSFARRTNAAGRVNWGDLVREDSAFGGDILAGDAYTHAWGLHWLLVTGHREEYTRYVRLLGGKQPLAPETADERVREFSDAFGSTAEQLQEDFRPQLELGLRRQKVSLAPEYPPGVSVTQSNLAEVQMKAVQLPNGVLQVEGTLRNISPVREMTFHVAVLTDSGTYAEWLVPDLGLKKSSPLTTKAAVQVAPGAPGGPSRTFRVQVRSTTPGSDQAGEWARGNSPIPALRRQ
ncbi:MAG: DUF1570 domain-containing protein [Planctomycetaceae bacterium]|nr:DUF1570 domain-containing protein [Planctomycetaceae bacterium]